jgi:hypothetical protein
MMDEVTMSYSHHSSQPRRSERTLEFITFTSPASAKSATNQRRVRSQAMRHFHRESDSSKHRKNEIELDVTPLLQQPAAHYDGVTLNGLTEPSQAVQFDEEPIFSLVTALDASRLDPFFQYPIRMGLRERELYDHRKSGSLSLSFEIPK